MNNIVIQKKELGNVQSSLDYFLKFNISKNLKILDVGCNYGSLIYNLYKLGYKNVQGIDVNIKTIKKGKKDYGNISKNINYYNGNKIPFENETFDVVLMFDVIEHIPNVQDFLKNEVYRVLKTGGIFIFQTPNKPINIIWVYIDNHSFNVKWWNEHCSLQTYCGLKRLLKNSGFNNIKIEKYNILTKHNKEKVSKKAGAFGLILLNLVSKMPLILYPNFWGYTRK